MISTERRDKAMRYLAETDELCAELAANVERAKWKAGQIKDVIRGYTDGSVAAKDAAVANSQEHQIAMQDYFDAIQDSLVVKNKRKTEELVVGLWQSEGANRRAGAVV